MPLLTSSPEGTRVSVRPDRGQRRTVFAGIVASFAILVSLGTASSASAGVESYCGTAFSPRFLYSGQDCYGNRHSLKSNRVFAPAASTFIVAASALNTSFQQYGGWQYGYNSYVCHAYGGSNTLHPWLYNADRTPTNMFGEMHYGVNRWC